MDVYAGNAFEKNHNGIGGYEAPDGNTFTLPFDDIGKCG
ncbi:hypothetical protein SDC9_167095 [bioreactor metagenome]|uniref:Uncharacterized protein n=1 Tax=bioreactor metagenome TaxID=1076179 RepID=A0A645G710_9ZZZZ